MWFLFFSCSYWVKLKLIKVQQTPPDATVLVVVIVAVLLLFLLMPLLWLCLLYAFVVKKVFSKAPESYCCVCVDVVVFGVVVVIVVGVNVVVVALLVIGHIIFSCGQQILIKGS